jgi:hypothetical protein
VKRFERFKSWVNENSPGRRIVCHFYIAEKPKVEKNAKSKEAKQKQYFTKVDYAFFNLLSDSEEWVVKGTVHNGIKDKYGALCRIPCLNCFEVDGDFLKSLKQLPVTGNDKFEVGILLNKRKLRSLFGRENVCDVAEWKHGDDPQPNKRCWRYDIFSQRRWVLNPFNYCKVIRVRIKKTHLRGLPITAIPTTTVMGLFVRKEDYNAVRYLPKVLENDLEVFPLL